MTIGYPSIRIGYAAGLLAIAAVCLIRCTKAPDHFVSLDPQTAYTGMESCQPCHQKIYASYLGTGMGQSLYKPDTARIIEQFGPQALVYHAATDLYYQPWWSGNTLLIKEFRLKGTDTTYLRNERVDYIVGSGHQTRSYLMERSGYWYEMPVTWYVHRQLWDMSPGYADNNTRFSREIGEECMACHTGAIQYVPGSKNKYTSVALGIDCEKCHGPGSVHIKLMQEGHLVDVGETTDYSIVNPAKLPVEKQFDVCQQCHLQGIAVPHAGKSVRDFRPGMRLSEVYEVFVEEKADPDLFGIASHAERLQQSRCFIASAGKLTCITCHDPHKSVGLTATDTHIKQCQGCHKAEQAPLCKAPTATQATMQGNCISCHMPEGGTRDIPHVSFHDHRIRVLKPRDTTSLAAAADYIRLRCATQVPPATGPEGLAWLQYYEQQDRDPRWLAEAARQLPATDLYARARVARYQQAPEEALVLVEEALRENTSADLLFLKGELLEEVSRFEEAYQAYLAAAKLQPESADAAIKTAVVLLKARPGDAAALQESYATLESWRVRRPFDARILVNLGFIALNQQQWTQAERMLAGALSLDPDYAQALDNMASLQFVTGHSQAARRYRDQLAQRHPAYPGLARLDQLLAGSAL